MEDQYDVVLKNKLGFFFNYKRFFIPSSILFPVMLFSNIFRNNFYIFISIFISLLILTWNFSYFTKIYYSKPIYFEDLEDDISEKKRIKSKIMYNIELSSKFKKRFIIFQQFLTSISFAIVAEYISIKYNNTEYNTIELLGVIGGLLSLQTKLIQICGRMFLSLLYYLKEREREQLLIQLNLLG
jgi:hypothetical protein